ncbi:conjugal transfer mating pair stabilization protein TraN [Sutterella sp.]|uniref:conjugal transfer mating pair stabilization protein TraN n=1 Tax=Sutterella sp. TaxID=1981025 RepID=UPI003FD78B71
MQSLFRKSLFRKSVCSFMAVVFGLSSTASTIAMAETPSVTPPSSTVDWGKSGNAFGKELGQGAKDGAPTFSGTSINFQTGGKNYSIEKDSLAPSDNGKNIRYQHTSEDFENQKNLYNNAGNMDEQGGQQKDELFADASSESPTLEGEVYSVLLDIANKRKSDYSQEVWLEKSTEIMGDMENVLKDLVSCDANSALDTQSKYTHVPDLKECQQVVDRSSTCNVDHSYSVGVIEHSDGPFNMDSCGEGCLNVWLGNPSDQNYRAPSNQCKLFEFTISLKLIKPEAITKVTLEDVYWDDQMQVYFGKKGEAKQVKMLQLPYPETFVPEFDENPGVPPLFVYPGPFSGASHTSCQQKISWHWDTSLDVTSLFRGATANDIYDFRIRVAVQDNGEGYARLNIHYDPSLVITNDVWQPKSCLDTADALADGMAKGSLKCTDMPTLNSNGCSTINGIEVCPSHLAESPINGVSPLCRRVEISTKYDFYKGDTGCWKALLGFDDKGEAIYEEVCGGQNIGGNLDTCTKYEDDPNCKFVESKCTEGMTGASGTCYVNDVTYDCGKDVKVDTVEGETTYDCKGVTCLGEECIDVNRTYNSDFGKVNALMNALQYMAEDMQCEGLDENGNPTGLQNVDCKVFSGESGKCKIAVGGYQDCCESMGTPGVGSYIEMIQNAQQFHSGMISMSDQVLTKSWTAMGQGEVYEPTLFEEVAGQYADAVGEVGAVIRSGVDYVAKAFGSSADNIYSFIDGITAPLKALKDEIIKQIQSAISKVLEKIMSQLGLNFGGAAAGGTATGGAEVDMVQNALNNVFGDVVGEAIGSAITFVGAVYLAYQIADIAIKMIYKCEQEEFETVSKREQKNCHYVGSYCESKVLGACIVKQKVYCCYQSPLSRIINEQIKMTQPQILEDDGDWGNPKNPKCSGVPLADVTKINWDLINLDEWTAILRMTGNLPTADKMTVEDLTGTGGSFNWTKYSGTLQDWNMPKTNGNKTDINEQNNSNKTKQSAQNSTAAVAAASEAPSLDSAGASTFARRSAKAMRSSAVAAASEESTGVTTVADTTKTRKDRRNVLERVEMRLNGMNVDGLRIESTPCITLELGAGMTARGGCSEAANTPLVCRKNGYLVECEDIAYENSLQELLGNKLNSTHWWNLGYRCEKNEISLDCSTLYSKDSYIKALEEYARIIGGTTYLNRYVCVDKSGTFTSEICENAMFQNGCVCNPGEFICQDGNKPISCGALGAAPSECACMDCSKECTYGGSPVPGSDGVMKCSCDEAPICDAQACKYGGEPAANGTQDCACEEAPDCKGKYGGEPVGGGTQDCTYYSAPDCTGEYGGEPKANGTQECNYYPAPNCTGSYGGYPLGGGTQACFFNEAPNCSAKCEFGGTPKADGTQDCICEDYQPISKMYCNTTKGTCEIYGGKAPYRCSVRSDWPADRDDTLTTNERTFYAGFAKPNCRNESSYTYITCRDSQGSTISRTVTRHGSRNCH